MRSHDIDYKIIGDDIQFVEIELDTGETVIAEAGAMVYMEEGIGYEAKMGDGSEPNQGLMDKLLSAGSRLIVQKDGFLCAAFGTKLTIRKLIRALAPFGKNRGKEAGSILGSFLER